MKEMVAETGETVASFMRKWQSEANIKYVISQQQHARGHVGRFLWSDESKINEVLISVQFMGGQVNVCPLTISI